VFQYQEQGVQDEIDVYFATFAKSLASTGAFIASWIIVWIFKCVAFKIYNIITF